MSIIKVSRFITKAEVMEKTMNGLSEYGLCPICLSKGKSRERSPNGNTTCKKGHTYKSSDSIDTLEKLNKRAGVQNVEND